MICLRLVNATVVGEVFQRVATS